MSGLDARLQGKQRQGYAEKDCHRYADHQIAQRLAVGDSDADFGQEVIMTGQLAIVASLDDIDFFFEAVIELEVQAVVYLGVMRQNGDEYQQDEQSKQSRPELNDNQHGHGAHHREQRRDKEGQMFFEEGDKLAGECSVCRGRRGGAFGLLIEDDGHGQTSIDAHKDARVDCPPCSSHRPDDKYHEGIGKGVHHLTLEHGVDHEAAHQRI